MYIFLDESGDLGFNFTKGGTTKFFTITLLICHNKVTYKGIKKAVSRTLKNKLNHKKKPGRIIQELKGTETTLPIKQYFLRQMPNSDWEIWTITVEKNNVYEYLQTKTGKKKLYNFLTKELLEKIKYSDFKDVERVNLIVDRRKDGADRKDFNAYIKSHLETSFSMVTEVYISHESSLDSPGLQAVDLFCWGIQRKEELNDEEWFNCFNSNVSRYIPYLRS